MARGVPARRPRSRRRVRPRLLEPRIARSALRSSMDHARARRARRAGSASEPPTSGSRRCSRRRPRSRSATPWRSGSRTIKRRPTTHSCRSTTPCSGGCGSPVRRSACAPATPRPGAPRRHGSGGGALGGHRVVDLSSFWAGPLAAPPAGRARRRGGEGRAAGRRRRVPTDAGAPQHLRRRQPIQARDHPRPARRRRPSPPARSRRRGRRGGRERGRRDVGALGPG